MCTQTPTFFRAAPKFSARTRTPTFFCTVPKFSVRTSTPMFFRAMPKFSVGTNTPMFFRATPNFYISQLFNAHHAFLVRPPAHIHFYAHQFLVNSAAEIGAFA
jgi:hypothetical protein